VVVDFGRSRSRVVCLVFYLVVSSTRSVVKPTKKEDGATERKTFLRIFFTTGKIAGGRQKKISQI
jgi:hypothetical protein